VLGLLGMKIDESNTRLNGNIQVEKWMDVMDCECYL